MNRPTISLSCIMKNEAHNLQPMLQSVKGCFDEIVIVDTGSTDTSVEFVNKINQKIEEADENWLGLPKIKLAHFEWVDDFSKARTFSMEQCTSDYMMWMDLDDSLSDAAAFIHWRDHVMHAAHYWLALYNYAFNEKGEVECQFIRERVVKLNYGFKWRYFVHEGLIKDDGGYWPQKANSWWINHRRSEDDKKRDYLRNVDLIKKYGAQGELPPRMNFYFGKELVENGFAKEGCEPLLKAIKSPDLELHDRILAIQYGAQSAIQCGAYAQAIDLLTNGLKIMVSRAEFWCSLGDIYHTHGQMGDAIQCYKTALNCEPNDLHGTIVIYHHAYSTHPKLKLSDIYLKLANFDEAKFWIETLGDHPARKEFEAELYRLMDLSTVKTNLPKVEDVVITCPPNAAVSDWDENSLAIKGHGGSETAAVEVARWIKIKTGRNVKVFNTRVKRETMASGVDYLPVSQLAGYIQNVEPYAHIAWRHATKFTTANTYVWCHDLQLPGGEAHQNYDKVIALSGFHKEYLKEVSRVPEEKIVIGFNGINPKDFSGEATEKDPLKVVFSSSPDRGLVQCIEIVKRAREVSGLDIKLHCFYGTENMRKMGHTAWADEIETKIKDNESFVVYHGMVPKPTLMKHFKESSVWLYVNDFIETYCITAIEAMCAGTWPIVRNLAAIPYTMKEAIERGCCDLMSIEAKTPQEVEQWANTLIAAIEQKKYQKMDFSLEKYSWERVAEWFIKELNL